MSGKRDRGELSDSSPDCTPVNKRHLPCLEPHCEGIDNSLNYHPVTMSQQISETIPPPPTDPVEFNKAMWNAMMQMKTDLKKLAVDVQDVKDSQSIMEDSVNNVHDLVAGVVEKHTKLETKVQELTLENSKLKEKVLSQEAYSKRYNLKFFNIEEEPNETTQKLLSKVAQVTELMEIDLKDLLIDNIHRLPQTRGKGPRPVIVKFVSMLDRNIVFNRKGWLKSKHSNVFIQDHLPVETEQNIRRLLPIRKAAISQGERVKMIGDKLVINSNTYTVKNLHQLPESLKPENVSVRKEDNHIFFFTGSNPLSNFYMCKFKAGETEYSCGEQFLQKAKADMFNDHQTAAKIMKATSPHEMKRLGDQVQNFSEQSWKDSAPQMVLKGLECKFRQNPKLKNYLLDTGENCLVEASVNDTFWGIGCHLYDPDILSKKLTWGSNQLGNVLMDIRNVLS